jgi:hypothetical protein
LVSLTVTVGVAQLSAAVACAGLAAGTFEAHSRVRSAGALTVGAVGSVTVMV